MLNTKKMDQAINKKVSDISEMEADYASQVSGLKAALSAVMLLHVQNTRYQKSAPTLEQQEHYVNECTKLFVQNCRKMVDDEIYRQTKKDTKGFEALH